jgi:alpha-galactosidase
MSQFWRLDGPLQTLVLAAKQKRLPQVIYWGPPLPASDDCTALAAAHALDVTGGMLDANPDLSICPEASQSFPGQPGLICRDALGRVLRPEFRFVKDLAQGQNLCLTYADEDLGLTYEAHFELTASSNILTCWSRLEATQPLMLNWLAAPVFPATQLSDAMMSFSGRWIGEFQTHSIPWRPGIHKRESRTGRSGHEHFPGLILPEIGARNTTGRAYGFHYGWSGGHQMIAEELPDGRRQIQFGHACDSHDGLAHSFETAKLYTVFSDNGLNGCGMAFQRHLRDHILTFPKASLPRPVHYNCWEAIYFDHDLASLKDIATRAKDLGAERFVLDDGWFGQRDDDSSSLGDWQIDRAQISRWFGSAD